MAPALGRKFAQEAEQKRAQAESERRRVAELEAEMERERQEWAAAEVAEEVDRLATEQARAAEVDEETVRLRAQMLAEHSWMAEYAVKSQQEAAALF